MAQKNKNKTALKQEKRTKNHKTKKLYNNKEQNKNTLKQKSTKQKCT